MVDRRLPSSPLTRILVAVLLLPIGNVSGQTTAIRVRSAVATDDKNNVTERTLFPASTGTIYISTTLSDLPAGAKVSASWVAIKTDQLEKNTKFHETTKQMGPGSFRYFFNFKPAKSWPIGTYRVDISVNGTVERSVQFQVSTSGIATQAQATERSAGSDQGEPATAGSTVGTEGSPANSGSSVKNENAAGPRASSSEPKPGAVPPFKAIVSLKQSTITLQYEGSDVTGSQIESNFRTLQVASAVSSNSEMPAADVLIEMVTKPDRSVLGVPPVEVSLVFRVGPSRKGGKASSYKRSATCGFQEAAECAAAIYRTALDLARKEAASSR